MNSQSFQHNRRLLQRYTDQPDVLPDAIRRKVESAWGGQAIQLYAMGDLDASLKLAQIWLLVGAEHCAVVRETEGDLDVTSFPRSKIKDVRETAGLSCTQLSLRSETGEPSLAVLRYSQRQRQAFSAIIFVLKQQLEGRVVSPKDADEAYADAMAGPIRKARSNKDNTKAAVVWRLLSYLKPYRVRFGMGVLAAFALTAVALVPPFLTKELLDGYVWPFSRGEITYDAAMHGAWWLLGILVAMVLARLGFVWLRLRFLTTVGEEVARDLRDDIYDHLHKLSVSYFSEHQTGSIISRVSSDTDRIWDFIAFGIAELMLSLLMILGLSTVLLLLDWQLGLILILPLPVIFYLIYLMGAKLHAVFIRIWQKWSNMTAVLSDTIPGMRVVKAFNQEDQERSRFFKRNRDVAEEANLIHKTWTTIWPLIFFMLEVMTLLVWFFALPRLFGEAGAGQTMQPGLFVSFLLYMGMFIGPIDQIGMITRMINRSLSSAHRVFEILDTEPDVVAKEEPIDPGRVEGHIAFEDVTFGYEPVRQILKGISFNVKPGEMIGLVGPSGSGKTTIINLIARFYDVQSGRVLIDGNDICDLDPGAYRSQIGMVLQDPYLFHGSLLDNIRYGHRNASLDEVVQAARAANAHEFICKLPQGYDTVVGERGHTLSGGERQRVSIARAILHNPRILILDEATSSVDTETERNIQDAIERLVSGRTVIAIAHRLSTLRRANRILVVKDGKLAEQGTHEELLALEDGVYRKLNSMQKELHEMYAV
ncbi:ABC transporter ATP-binding protein [Rubellicoccus peritrichatus]|uniref:ABC transporter ATP-binding protein n=1 Tax=Rubellicoccus peritrichatus TaxID=3080537 RepID=A0AAQ3LDG9_9BACT|nr:ABC transporter ATP-binding protein [Puniceicoccus sp. CR14]WOO43362.1 ABC transporter ATP-binding protein [Puniceicoccus sp. CR14]